MADDHPRRGSTPGDDVLAGRDDRATVSGTDPRGLLGPDADDRATVPAVGKALEAGVVVLYVGLLTAALFGGYVGDYRTAAGEEVADRTLAAASHRIEAAIPPPATVARSHVRVDLPVTIRGDAYRIRAEGRTLVLDHPAAGVGGRIRLALPGRVMAVTGSWHSSAPAAVRVEPHAGGVAVRLVSGPAAESGLSGEDGSLGDGPRPKTEVDPIDARGSPGGESR